MQGGAKARKLGFSNFSWSLKFKFLELCSSYYNQVSDGERVLAQANCSMSGFGKVEEVSDVSSATTFLDYNEESKGSCMTSPFS